MALEVKTLLVVIFDVYAVLGFAEGTAILATAVSLLMFMNAASVHFEVCVEFETLAAVGMLNWSLVIVFIYEVQRKTIPIFQDGGAVVALHFLIGDDGLLYYLRCRFEFSLCIELHV
jgi:hypothetical protein